MTEMQKRTRMTRDNTAVLLVDHQIGLFTGVRDISLQDLKHNVVGLAKGAKVLGLPIVPITTARDSLWGPTIPELRAVLDGEIIDRSSVNAWDHKRFVDAVKATGRDHLILAGVSFEVCASLPANASRTVLLLEAAEAYRPNLFPRDLADADTVTGPDGHNWNYQAEVGLGDRMMAAPVERNKTVTTPASQRRG